MLEALLLLLYPGLIFMLLNSHTLVNVALGRRWMGVAPIFQWLGLDAFIAPLLCSMGWLFISQGRTTELRDWSVPTPILFVCAFVIGLRWGPEGIAAGYAAASLGEMSYLWRIATRTGPLRGRDFWASLMPFLFCIATTCAVLLGVAAWLPGTVGRLLVSLALAYTTFTASLAVFPRGRALLGELARQASHRLPVSWRTVGTIRPATEGLSL
jgi:polysaccharide transporter, PST family